MKKPSLFLLLFAFLASTSSTFAHDAWLAAKWNKEKNRIVISALVAEQFPNGDPIKGLQRFVEPRAHVLGGHSIGLTGDPSDSTLLGSLSPAPSIVVATGVKQREIKFKRDLAERYLVEEVGMTKEEAMKLLTPGAQEFEETYSRYLKTVVATHSHAPKDSTLDLPLEIILTSWSESQHGKATIRFRLLNKGTAVLNAPVRVLVNGNTTIVRTDEKGESQASVDSDHHVLIAYIHVTKLADNRLNSLWTNLAIYRLEQ